MTRDGIPFLVRSGRNPFEILLLVMCATVGVVGLCQPSATSNVVTSLLPTWEVIVWYAGLAIGGLVSLLGVFLSGVVSLLIERVGLIMLTCLTLTYSTAVIAQIGIKGILPALFPALFAVACVDRFARITADLKRMENVIITRSDGDE